jgi:hypothetical protein
LVTITNPKYRYSALVPTSVFPNPALQTDAEHTFFESENGKTTLHLIVEAITPGRKLEDVYREWTTGFNKHPNRSVGYKVLKTNWFVASGKDGERGFYLKCVARDQKLFFMLLEYDEENCPISEGTLTAMSRSFTAESSPQTASLPLATPAAWPGERFPETRFRVLIIDDVRGWDEITFRYAINELYARGGYDFQNPEVRAVFSQLSWYQQRRVPGRTQDQAAAHLSRVESVNLEFLQKLRGVMR